jgi:hypothetical protein
VTSRFGFCSLILLATLLAAPATARADAKAEARRHFEYAKELIDDGQMAQAVIELQRCYEIMPHHTVLYNLGQAYVTMGKPVEAMDAFERYLKEGGGEISAERRAEVQKEIARQRVRIATLEIRGAPAGAVLRVDGKMVGVAPLYVPIRIGMGSHTVSATADDYRPAEQTVVLVGEDRKVVELNMAKLPPQWGEPGPAPAPAQVFVSPPPPVPAAPAPVVVAPAPPPEAPVVSNPGSALRVTGVVVGVAGVLGLAGGGLSAYLSSKRHDQAVDQWLAYRDEDARSSQSSAKDFARIANISFIAGGVVAATGVVLYLAAPSGNATSSGARAGVWPAAGPGFVGMASGGTW